MSIHKLWNLIRGADRKVWVFLAIAFLGFVSLFLGAYVIYQTHFQHPKYTYLPVDEEWKAHLGSVLERSRGEEISDAQAMVIEVSGAVEKPGVYALQTGARLQDALLMAGGFLESSDQRFIHRELNLSSLIQDQQKIYIPFQGEDIPSSEAGETALGGFSAKNLNTATVSELKEVSGVGDVRAAAIVAAQPYTSKEDFLARAGIPQSIAEDILQEFSIL